MAPPGRLPLRLCRWLRSGGSPTRSRRVPCGPGRGPVPTLPPRDRRSLLQPHFPVLCNVLCREEGEAVRPARSQRAQAAHGPFCGAPHPSSHAWGGGRHLLVCFGPTEAASPAAEDKRLRGGAGVQGTLPPPEPHLGRGPGGTAPCRVPPLRLNGGRTDWRSPMVLPGPPAQRRRPSARAVASAPEGMSCLCLLFPYFLKNLTFQTTHLGRAWRRVKLLVSFKKRDLR